MRGRFFAHLDRSSHVHLILVILRAYGQRIDGNDLKGAGNPADDWIFHAQLAKGALCHRYNLDPARYEAAESQFIQAFLMPHLIETSFFKYRSVVVLHESFPWPKYEGSMEADRHSYFHVNLEQLRNRHSATLHGKDNEVDGRVFLQSQKPSGRLFPRGNVAFPYSSCTATPRRYIRNQNRATMNSVRSSPSVKGLGQILSKVRSANVSSSSFPDRARLSFSPQRSQTSCPPHSDQFPPQAALDLPVTMSLQVFNDDLKNFSPPNHSTPPSHSGGTLTSVLPNLRTPSSPKLLNAKELSLNLFFGGAITWNDSVPCQFDSITVFRTISFELLTERRGPRR